MPVRLLLRLEGLAVAVAGVVLYAHGDHKLVAVRAPRPRARPRFRGVWDSNRAVAIALIWLVHIGVDRVIGYGLKYPSGFQGHPPPTGLDRPQQLSV